MECLDQALFERKRPDPDFEEEQMGIKRKAQRSRGPQGSRGPNDFKERAAKNIDTAVAMHQASVMLKKEFDKGIRGTEEEQARLGGHF